MTRKVSPIIGVLDLQGDVIEHVRSLEECGAQVIRVKTASDLKKVDGLIIPGGESTTIWRLLKWYKLIKPICECSKKGMPIYGTCAGTILLERLGLMDIEVERNAYGRQLDSFEAEIKAQLNGKSSSVLGVFIRAPKIKTIGKNVELLAQFGSDKVMIRENNLLATTFHPELTDDLSIHRYFLSMIHESK